MTFLKKLGSIVLKATEIITGIGPLVVGGNPQAQGVVNVVSSELTQLGQVITTVEAIGQSLSIKGPDKLIAAGPLVAQVIVQSSLMAGKKIDNEDLFKKACSEIAGGMADLLNSLKANFDTQSLT